jgi:hypothetical protein
MSTSFMKGNMEQAKGRKKAGKEIGAVKAGTEQTQLKTNRHPFIPLPSAFILFMAFPSP